MRGTFISTCLIAPIPVLPIPYLLLTLILGECPKKIFIEKYLLNTAQLCWADENRIAKR